MALTVPSTPMSVSIVDATGERGDRDSQGEDPASPELEISSRLMVKLAFRLHVVPYFNTSSLEAEAGGLLTSWRPPQVTQ